MPCREINGIEGIQITGPEFMMIDYYRMMTDVISYWRIEKAVKRFYLLQKYYPFPYIRYPISISEPADSQKDVNRLLDLIFNFVQDNQNTVVVGFYAYNQFLKASGILGSVPKDNESDPNLKKFKYLEVPYYEIIAINYRTTALALINQLKATDSDDIHAIENYPFFQYLGYSVDIFYKNTLIAKVYDNNKRCVPYTTVPSDHFGNRLIEKGTKTIHIGTVSTVILYALIVSIKARVDQDKSTKDLYYALISHITEMKNYYFNKTNKTIYDKSIFQEFTMECKGIPLTPEHERQLIIESRKKRNKKFIFSYEPGGDELTRDDINYIFANSSGNPIKNLKNLKLSPESSDKDIYEEVDDNDDL